MTAWADRPQLAAAYLNPAVVASIIATASQAYQSARSQRMIWPMAFVVCPMLLHRPTRLALPASTATHLTAWVSRNALVHVGFAARARELAPATREGLRFGLRYGVLSIESGGLIATIGTSRDPELRTLLNAARLVGRWFAKIDQPATVFAILGVEP